MRLNDFYVGRFSNNVLTDRGLQSTKHYWQNMVRHIQPGAVQPYPFRGPHQALQISRPLNRSGQAVVASVLLRAGVYILWKIDVGCPILYCVQSLLCVEYNIRSSLRLYIFHEKYKQKNVLKMFGPGKGGICPNREKNCSWEKKREG